MSPLILKNATVIDRSAPATHRAVDVTISAGRITGIGATPRHEHDEAVDLSGWVLLPAPVEAHAHLDKAFLAETILNPAGDLDGAIAAMTASRHRVTLQDTVERAERAARLMAANGYVAVRTHADVTTDGGLASVEALIEVRRRVADVIDVQIVGLAGSPIVGPAGAATRDLLLEALALGIDLVGGCPYRDSDIETATAVLLDIANEHGVGIDFHTDETLDPTANGLDILARQVLDGFAHAATASHCVSLEQQPLVVQHATAERVAQAGIGVVTLPHTNLFLQGRGRSPMPRGLTALEVLRDAGVTVAAGADNLQDPFNPLGRACPFETAGLMLLAGHALPHDAWDFVSTAAATVIGRRAAGHAGELGLGGPADLLAVRAGTIREAIAWAPIDRRRWRAGVED